MFGFHATTPVNNKIEETPNISNITYTNESQWLKSYDIFLPTTTENKPPLLVWIHGGAWVSGDKREYSHFAKSLSDKGIAVALLNYRLSSRDINGSIKYPDHIIDCLLGFNHIIKNPKNVNYDIENIFLGGHSAGSQISSLMALKADSLINDNNSKKDLLNSISKVKGIISLGGIFDLPLLSNQNKNYQNDFIIPAFGEDIKNNNLGKSTWEEASPQYITKKEIDNILYNKLPSVLLIDSIQDPLVHEKQSINFQSKLKSLNFSNVTLSQGEYGDHYYIPNNLAVIDQVASFITFLSKLKPTLFRN